MPLSLRKSPRDGVIAPLPNPPGGKLERFPQSAGTCVFEHGGRAVEVIHKGDTAPLLHAMSAERAAKQRADADATRVATSADDARLERKARAIEAKQRSGDGFVKASLAVRLFVSNNNAWTEYQLDEEASRLSLERERANARRGVLQAKKWAAALSTFDEALRMLDAVGKHLPRW